MLKKDQTFRSVSIHFQDASSILDWIEAIA